MLIEKADMLDALLGNFAGMDLLSDAVTEGSITLGYVTGWLDAIGTLIDVEKKKHDKRKELLEQLKQSGARVNAEGFWRYCRADRERPRNNDHAGGRVRGVPEVHRDRDMRENERR
nr:MAG TPA: hypothetical protein [Caudoviricetes sp.]